MARPQRGPVRRAITGLLRGPDLKHAPTRLAGLNAGGFGTIAGPVPASAAPGPGTSLDQLMKGALAGRQSQPTTTTIFGSMTYVPRRQALGSLDGFDLSKFTPEQVIEVLSNASPELAMSCWNVLRLHNSGWDVTVSKPNGKDDPVGTDIAHKLLKEVNARYGGVDTLLDQFALINYLEGAVCAEYPPASGLNGIEDIYPIRPASIRFRWVNLGTEENPRYDLAMQQWVLTARQPIWLNAAQTRYIPLDPYVDDPYGRPPAHAAIGAILFWLDVLRDLRRALHTSAWGRLDMEVLYDSLKVQAPEEVQEDDERLRQWMSERMEEIKAAWATLEPDDSLIHLDSMKFKQVDMSGKLFQIGPLLRSVETLIIRGLKSLPTLMGGVESRGAAGLGTLEYQITTAGIGVFQRMSSSLIEAAINLHLRLNGRQGFAEFQFEPIRTTDRLKDAQAQSLEIDNNVKMRDEGFIAQNEASIAVTGHDADAPGRITDGPLNSTLDRPSPAPMPTNDQNPKDGTGTDPKMPSVGETTGEGGDQLKAPQPGRVGPQDRGSASPAQEPGRADREIDALLAGLTLSGVRG